MNAEVTEAWEFAFVVHNLAIPHPSNDRTPGEWPRGISVVPEVMAIVSQRDERVEAIRASTPAVEQILRSFRDEHGKSYDPAVMIVSKAFPQKLRNDLEAFVACRNATAVSCLLRSRAALASGHGDPPATWSDTFDFHPAQVGGSGRMILQSPALLSLVSDTASITLGPSPHVALAGRRLWADAYLMRALGAAWRRRFIKSHKGSQFTRSLFRSLETAYQACAIGAKNSGSIHDYGLQVAQWVSAIEILAWPSQRHANLEAVLALLAAYPTRREVRRKRYRAKVRGRPTYLSAPQRAYAYMYRARNRFLHGNNVSSASLMTLAHSKPAPIPRIAALVYRAALVAYLDQRYPKKIETLRELAERSDEMFDDSNYDEGFANVFGFELED